MCRTPFNRLHPTSQSGRCRMYDQRYTQYRVTMVAIDLFAGAGGMSVGAFQAGINVRFAVECDPYAARAYRHNHPKCELFDDDIRHLTAAKISQIPHGSDGTVIFGGPPCQGFSYSNTRTRDLCNSDNLLYEEFLRVIKIWQPDFVVFENVQGIVNTAKGRIMHAIIDGLNDLKYTTNCGILNALHFGVPQSRSRFFLLGSRNGHRIALPSPTTSTPITVKESISDLPFITNGEARDWLPYGGIPPSRYAQRLRKRLRKCSGHLVTNNSSRVLDRYEFIPPGGNWKHIPVEMMKNYTDLSRCHTGIYYRLRCDQPSIVIGNYRKNMLIHPTENRGLSVREAARLQSFPDSYQFVGSIGFQQQQVGNAVPPQLAKHVFEQLR